MSTLYFIGGAASDEQKALAKKTGAKIRNSKAYHKGDFLESCDYVMGDVPKEYADKFKSAKASDAAKKLIKTVEVKIKE